MKKILTLLLLATLLLTACANPNPPVDGEIDMESIEMLTNEKDLSTEQPVESVTSSPPYSNGLDDDFGYRVIDHLRDFYTFAQTGSINPDDYEGDLFKNQADKYHNQFLFEEKELVRLEDLGFVSTELLNDFYFSLAI